MSISSSDNAEGIGTVKKTEIGAEGMHTYLTCHSGTGRKKGLSLTAV